MENLSSIQMSRGNSLRIVSQPIESLTKQKYCPVVKIVRDYNYPIGRIKVTSYDTNLNKKMHDYISKKWGNFTLFNLKQFGKFAINLSHFIVFIIHTHWRERFTLLKILFIILCIIYSTFIIHYIYIHTLYIHTYIRTIIRNI